MVSRLLFVVCRPHANGCIIVFIGTPVRGKVSAHFFNVPIQIAGVIRSELRILRFGQKKRLYLQR